MRRIRDRFGEYDGRFDDEELKAIKKSAHPRGGAGARPSTPPSRSSISPTSAGGAHVAAAAGTAAFVVGQSDLAPRRTESRAVANAAGGGRVRGSRQGAWSCSLRPIYEGV
jgi:hypothetical protein